MGNITKKEFLLLVDEGISSNKTILTLKTDVAGLKTDMLNVKEEQHRQGIMMEELRDNVNLIVEGISPLLKKSESMEELTEKLDKNNDQIAIVETSLKSHIKNKNIHRQD